IQYRNVARQPPPSLECRPRAMHPGPSGAHHQNFVQQQPAPSSFSQLPSGFRTSQPPQHLVQQQQHPPVYGYPQQSFFHGATEFAQHAQAGTYVAVNENGQPIGYYVPQYQQWRPQQQQQHAYHLPPSSNARRIRPSSNYIPSSPIFSQHPPHIQYRNVAR
uniref:Uncharacterized protein n=1 Tax=Panagrolaimus sp. PS1159 TaxID=55785 RepID=A0AC35EV54_9BILA